MQTNSLGLFLFKRGPFNEMCAVNETIQRKAEKFERILASTYLVRTKEVRVREDRVTQRLK